MRAARDRLAGGAVHGNPARADQRVDAADVIAMMMRREDRGELDTLARAPFLYRRGVTRIDERGAPADPDRPDVVVAERGDRDNRGHGSIFRSARAAVNDAQ